MDIKKVLSEATKENNLKIVVISKINSKKEGKDNKKIKNLSDNLFKKIYVIKSEKIPEINAVKPEKIEKMSEKLNQPVKQMSENVGSKA